MIKHTVRIGRMVGGILLLIIGAILALPMVPGPGIVVGLVLLVVGVVLALPLVPGPGIVVMAIGVGLLSQEFAWARRVRSWVQGEVERLRSRDVG